MSLKFVYNYTIRRSVRPAGDEYTGFQPGFRGRQMREEFREKFRVLGLKIAYYRKLRGLTQEQLAEAIGRSVSFVSQIEANNAADVKGVSLETLFLISEKLDVPVSRLFED